MWRFCDLYGRLQPASNKHRSDARHVLERVIFPESYTDPTVKTGLFVGVDPYTSWYPTVFRTRPGLSFSPIDSDLQAARWGARRVHRVGACSSDTATRGRSTRPWSNATGSDRAGSRDSGTDRHPTTNGHSFICFSKV
jgi:hypothetical protein